MKPYADSIVPPGDLVLFHQIKRVIEALPDIDLGADEKGEKILVSGHMVTRALVRFFPSVRCGHGYFGGTHEHSWLITRSGLVIDVYPVAATGGPILIDIRFISPWSSLYEEVYLPGLKGIRFKKNVNKLARAVRQTMTALEIQEKSNSLEARAGR